MLWPSFTRACPWMPVMGLALVNEKVNGNGREEWLSREDESKCYSESGIGVKVELQYCECWQWRWRWMAFFLFWSRIFQEQSRTREGDGEGEKGKERGRGKSGRGVRERMTRDLSFLFATALFNKGAACQSNFLWLFVPRTESHLLWLSAFLQGLAIWIFF